MNDNQEKILDKVKKLLALAGNNPNENEAQQAANRAHALLAEYNLSLSDVESHSKFEDKFITDSDLMTESLPWRRPLAAMVAKMYFCSYVFAFQKKPTPDRACGYIRYDKHYFIGARHNVEVAKHMFSYLNDTIERLANEGSMGYPMRERTPFRTAFKAACAGRVCTRIQQRIDESKKGPTVTNSGGTNLPALANLYDQVSKKLDKYLDQQFPGHRTSKSRGRPSHTEGTIAGRRAGDSIGLDQQVGRGQSKLLK
jgi:hypothetical protein